MPAYEPLLEARHLTNYYEGIGGLFGGKAKKALSDVSFDIGKGEVFGVVGESGCGKSTLCKAILGLIEYEGQILVDGELLGSRYTKAQRAKVQMVFQDPNGALNPKKRIGWIMEEPLRIHKLYSKVERLKRIDSMLELIGLDSSYKTRFPSELSGGQKQRVCIGASLMLNPALLVADEPVSALDVSAGAQILNLLKDLHQRLSLSILLISHNLNVVYYMSDRIAVMRDGQIVELGKAEDIYNSAKHSYTKALLAAIPDIAQERAAPALGAGFASRPEAGPEIRAEACRYCSLCPDALPICASESPELKSVGLDETHLVRCHRA
ncbi:MAG: ATP-binding cassette domain-containing protein [Clostridiales bacterium]|jgi:oligopeptide/dipeptide ABC transporter ATP-binding protein|nr:ATP-binding cassette domain-containing protein [Clostridiales bacterium]